MRLFSNILVVVLFQHCESLWNPFKSSKPRISATDCCLPPKVNVNARKFALGENFLRQLTIDSDMFEAVTPESMCHLMHFLFQRATINKKPVTVNAEMFVLFDESNRVLGRLAQSNYSEVYPMTANAGRFRHLFNRQKNTNDRYSVYGMDIPGACLPNNFDRIVFGELPAVSNEQPGQRLFLKAQSTTVPTSILSLVKKAKNSIRQRFCQWVQGEAKSECVKIRALKENVDKFVARRWMILLSKLPKKLQIAQQYRSRADIQGIYEIAQQLTALEAAGGGRDVKRVRQTLVDTYGQDDLRLRQGREILLTVAALKRSHPICSSAKDPKRC